MSQNTGSRGLQSAKIYVANFFTYKVHNLIFNNVEKLLEEWSGGDSPPDKVKNRPKVGVHHPSPVSVGLITGPKLGLDTPSLYPTIINTCPRYFTY